MQKQRGISNYLYFWDLYKSYCYVMLWLALNWRGQEWAQHVQDQLLHTCIMQAAGSSHVMELLTDSI